MDQANQQSTELAPPLAFPDALHELTRWILNGDDEHDLRKRIRERFSHLSADELLTKAAQHFQTAGECEPEAIRGFCIEAYRDLYRRCIDSGDLPTALKALARLEQTSKR